MKLPIPFLNSKKENSDYYLALILTDEKASAVILQADNGTIKTISSHDEFFPASVEELDLEAFINAIDKTISRAEEVLPPDIETHQTVFGVKANWVDPETKKIKKEYLDKLKKVCDALDLTPVGFMVTTEAVIHLVQDEEGAPLSAVLAEIRKKQITLSLLRGGAVIESVSGVHGESAPASVDKLLNHFTVPVLPARIILLLNKPDERTQQAFISHQWSKSLPFLHMPQVTILPAAFDSRAVMYGAATQMGFSVIDTDFKTLPKVGAVSENETEEMALAEESPESSEKEITNDNFEPVSTGDEEGADFGFVVDGEPRESEPVHHEPVHHEEAHKPIHEPEVHHEASEFEHDQMHEETHEKKASLLASLPFLKSLKQLKLPKVSGFAGSKKPYLKILIPLVAIVLLIAGLSYYYLNNVKATVLLRVTPNMVNQDDTVVFSTTAPNDFSKKVIAARSISTTIDGEVSTDATGKKDVGDKAKGTITIYNNSDEAVTLSSGTEVKATSGQIFTLDKSTNIEAASGDIFTGTKPGTADASVTAKELGTEGNLPSGTRFTIGSNNTLAAKNDSAFSGGTKKNVTVISKADLAKLRTDLPKKVQSQAPGKLATQAESGETVLPLVGAGVLQKEKFDKKEGDEAKKVTLLGTVSFSGMAYKNDELKEYAQTVIKSKYDQDVTVEEDSIKAEVSNSKLTNPKSAQASVAIKAGLLPKINTQDVIDNIQEKSLSHAKDTIANLPQVAQTDIIFSPPIPLLPNLFPRLPKQISVEVKTQ